MFLHLQFSYKVQCLYAHCRGDADFLKAHSKHGAISSFMEACSQILESVSALVTSFFSSVAECMGGDKIINVKGEQWLSFSMDKPKVLLSVLTQFCCETSNPTQEAFQTLERAGLVNADLIQLKKEATTLVQMVACPVQEDERKVSNFAADYFHTVNNQYFEL